MANVSVWVHWFIGVLCLVELVYRPHYGVGKYVAYALVFGLLMAFNAYIHYRLLKSKAVTWRWMLGLCIMDVAIVSVSVAMSNGFSHYFFHRFYYPSLAGFAVIFTSFRLNMAWVTLVCAVYVAISLSVGGGLDLEARDEKPLLVRIATMYAVVATVNLVSRFERTRWRRAVARERVEFSRAVHDTTAQWACMIGLGVEGAMEVVGESNEELKAKLRLVAELSRSAMWELRHPIDGRQIFRGRRWARSWRPAPAPGGDGGLGDQGRRCVWRTVI